MIHDFTFIFTHDPPHTIQLFSHYFLNDSFSKEFIFFTRDFFPHDSLILHVFIFTWPAPPTIQLFSCDFFYDSFFPERFIFFTCDLFHMLHLDHMIVFTWFIYFHVISLTVHHIIDMMSHTYLSLHLQVQGRTCNQLWNICDFSLKKV